MLVRRANFLQQFFFFKNIPWAKQICPEIQQTISIKKGKFLVGKKSKRLISKNILKSLIGERKLRCKILFFYAIKNHSAWAEEQKKIKPP